MDFGIFSPKINVKVIKIPILFYRCTSYSLFKYVGFGKILKQNQSNFLVNHSNNSYWKIVYLIALEAWCVQSSIVDYRKVKSSNTSCLEAHAGFFRLLIKGKFDLYVL